MMSMLTHQAREEIKAKLQELPPLYLTEMFRAFRVLDASLSQTIGKKYGGDWLDRVSGVNIPYDLASVMSKNLVPDENGILQVAERSER